MLIMSLQPLAWLAALLLGWLDAIVYRSFDIGIVRVFSAVRISIVTLAQLMDSPRNVNHAISIVGHWICYSSYDKALCLTQESLDIICYPSIGKTNYNVLIRILFCYIQLSTR